MKHALASVMLLSLFTACDDNEDNKPDKPDPAVVPVAVDYETAEGQLVEDKGSFPVIINFSDAAEAAGAIEVTVSGDAAYGTLYTTSPAAIDGKILLNVEEGDTQAQLTVVVTDNAKLNGHKSAAFSITSATGGVALGEVLEFVLAVKDDELLNRPQTATKVASAFSQSKNTYEYNEDGLVTEIHWESKTPFGTTKGTDEYFYAAGQLQRIVRAGGVLEQKYIWENDRVTKFEQVVSGEVTFYNNYVYNGDGQLTRIDNFTKDAGSDFQSRSYTAYSYYGDGNVFQVTNYALDEEGAFIATQVTTYSDYVAGHNPADVTDPVPNPTGEGLPTYYSRESSDGIQEYTVSYEFLADGRMFKRNVAGAAGDTGVTTYVYFD